MGVAGLALMLGGAASGSCHKVHLPPCGSLCMQALFQDTGTF